MDDFYISNEFKVQKLSRGGFIDNVNGKVFTISTFTIRLNQKALDEFFDSEVFNHRSCYEKEEDYQKHLKEKAEKKDAWQTKVCDLLGLPVEHTTIKQIVSEIFGVCHISE